MIRVSIKHAVPTPSIRCNSGKGVGKLSIFGCAMRKDLCGMVATSQLMGLLFLFRAAFLCPPLDDPTNGNVDVPSREVGSTATYSCNPGYELSGLETRSCQGDGDWFGFAPQCVPGKPD